MIINNLRRLIPEGPTMVNRDYILRDSEYLGGYYANSGYLFKDIKYSTKRIFSNETILDVTKRNELVALLLSKTQSNKVKLYTLQGGAFSKGWENVDDGKMEKLASNNTIVVYGGVNGFKATRTGYTQTPIDATIDATTKKSLSFIKYVKEIDRFVAGSTDGETLYLINANSSSCEVINESVVGLVDVLYLKNKLLGLTKNGILEIDIDGNITTIPAPNNIAFQNVIAAVNFQDNFVVITSTGKIYYGDNVFSLKEKQISSALKSIQVSEDYLTITGNGVWYSKDLEIWNKVLDSANLILGGNITNSSIHHYADDGAIYTGHVDYSLYNKENGYYSITPSLDGEFLYGTTYTTGMAWYIDNFIFVEDDDGCISYMDRFDTSVFSLIRTNIPSTFRPLWFGKLSNGYYYALSDKNGYTSTDGKIWMARTPYNDNSTSQVLESDEVVKCIVQNGTNNNFIMLTTKGLRLLTADGAITMSLTTDLPFTFDKYDFNMY